MEVMKKTSGGLIPCKVELTEEEQELVEKVSEILDRAVERMLAKTASTDINYYIALFAEKNGFETPYKAFTYLAKLYNIYPQAAKSTLLRTIAVEFDNKYTGHIEKSEHVYAISTLNGKIEKADKKHIRNYKNFAAFRTVEDAKAACKLVSQFKCMVAEYNAEQEQKNKECHCNKEG